MTRRLINPFAAIRENRKKRKSERDLKSQPAGATKDQEKPVQKVDPEDKEQESAEANPATTDSTAPNGGLNKVETFPPPRLAAMDKGGDCGETPADATEPEDNSSNTGDDEVEAATSPEEKETKKKLNCPTAEACGCFE